MIGDLQALGYRYRPDGNFLIALVCSHCAERYDVHALSNALSEQNQLNLCDACFAVRQMEAV
jgi:hypothetical protein